MEDRFVESPAGQASYGQDTAGWGNAHYAPMRAAGDQRRTAAASEAGQSSKTSADAGPADAASLPDDPGRGAADLVAAPDGLDREPADLTGAPDDLAREPAGDARRGADPGGLDAPGRTPLLGDPAQLHQKLHEIQAAFVDDPRESVTRAADLADIVVNNLLAVAQERKLALRGSWDGGEADTEQLRNALRRYRVFIDRLCGV